MTNRSALQAISLQFVVYAAVGATGTLAHFVVLAVLVEVVGTGPTFGSACGFVVGAVVNYVLNYRITFSHTRGHLETAPRFAAVAVLGGMLNVAIMYVLSAVLQWHYLLCQVIATATVLAYGFSANRFWTFGRRSQEVDGKSLFSGSV